MKRLLLNLVLTVILPLFVFGGCSEEAADSGGEVKGDSATAVETLADGDSATAVEALADGVYAEVELEILEDGTLYALSIEIEDDDDDAKAGDDDNDDKDLKDEFKAQVDAEADHFLSFSVLGGLTVVMEADDEDEDDIDCQNGFTPDGQPCEDDDEDDEAEEDDGDDIQCQDGLTPDGQTCEDDDADDEDEEEDLEIAELEAGIWVEVKGSYSEEDGTFFAEKIQLADDNESKAEGVISGLGDSSFSIFGLTITFDDNTLLDVGDDNDDDEENEDDDDIECEQEGESEGDNEGCN